MARSEGVTLTLVTNRRSPSSQFQAPVNIQNLPPSHDMFPNIVLHLQPQHDHQISNGINSIRNLAPR